MARDRNSLRGGPMNVGAYRNYPYWAAPKVWKDAVKFGIICAIMGAVAMCSVLQKEPNLKNGPLPKVTVTKTVEFSPEQP